MWFIYIFKAKIRCVNSQTPPHPSPTDSEYFDKQQKYLDKYDNNYGLTLVPEFYKTDILYLVIWC